MGLILPRRKLLLAAPALILPHRSRRRADDAVYCQRQKRRCPRSLDFDRHGDRGRKWDHRYHRCYRHNRGKFAGLWDKFQFGRLSDSGGQRQQEQHLDEYLGIVFWGLSCRHNAINLPCSSCRKRWNESHLHCDFYRGRCGGRNCVCVQERNRHSVLGCFQRVIFRCGINGLRDGSSHSLSDKRCNLDLPCGVYCR